MMNKEEIIEKCKIKKKPLESLHTIAFNIELMGITCFGDDFREIENHLNALKIIAEKGLPLIEKDMIKQSENYEQYQIKISWWNYKPFTIPKTEEEFNLLKRYCDEQDN